MVVRGWGVKTVDYHSNRVQVGVEEIRLPLLGLVLGLNTILARHRTRTRAKGRAQTRAGGGSTVYR